MTFPVDWNFDSDGVLTINGSGSMEDNEYLIDIPWKKDNQDCYVGMNSFEKECRIIYVNEK